MAENQFESVKYIPDFDLNSSYEEIDAFDNKFSTEEEEILQEILELEQGANVGSHFMSDMLEAVKKGALDYVDSMTDTTDTISEYKRSEKVKKWDNCQIEPINTSANKKEADSSHPRTLKEANKSA